MKAYLLSIAGIIMMAGIIITIIPEGKMLDGVKGIVKLCCLIVIISPMIKFFKNIYDGKENNFFPNFSNDLVIETDESFIDYCSDKKIKDLEKFLEKNIKEHFYVDVCVYLEWEYKNSIILPDGDDYISNYEGKEIKITKMKLKVNGENILEKQRKEIKNYYYEKCGCEVIFIE